MIKVLKNSQQVTIRGITYMVTGMLAYTQEGSSCSWKEYQLQPLTGKPFWLSIEIDDGGVGLMGKDEYAYVYKAESG